MITNDEIVRKWSNNKFIIDWKLSDSNNLNPTLIPVNLTGVFNRVCYLIDNRLSTVNKCLPHCNRLYNNNIIEDSNNILNNNQLQRGKQIDNYCVDFEALDSLSEASSSKYVPNPETMAHIKSVANNEVIDVHYMPQFVKRESKQYIGSRVKFHLNTIYQSVLLNAYQIKKLMKLNGTPFNMYFTKSDIVYSLKYWYNKLPFDKKFLDEYIEDLEYLDCIESDIHEFMEYELPYEHICNKFNILPYEHMFYSINSAASELYHNRLDIHIFRNKQVEERAYDKVVSYDGEWRLFIPSELKQRLQEWYNTDSKSVSKFLKTELETHFIMNKGNDVNGEEYNGLRNIMVALSKAKMKHKSTCTMSQCSNHRIALEHWFDSVKTMIGDQTDARKFINEQYSK